MAKISFATQTVVSSICYTIETALYYYNNDYVYIYELVVNNFLRDFDRNVIDLRSDGKALKANSFQILERESVFCSFYRPNLAAFILYKGFIISFRQ